MTQRILIVGGVAGGASCAARLRRLSETAEIIVFDRGPYVSFANCGLPYYVGDVITDEQKLLVANADLFRNRFNIETRVLNEVLSIDRAAKTISVKNLTSGETYQERYDALVLAPGARPLRPPIPGIDLPGIFALRTIPDSRQIRTWIAEHQVREAVVVGGGFIGLEMAENLVHRGIHVTLIEALAQVMPPLDPEMAAPMHNRLRERGVNLQLLERVTAFESIGGEDAGDRLAVQVVSGATYPADLVILGIGVRPETALAQAAGLELGDRGGIRVNEHLQTSDPHIWAVGDAVEDLDYVTGESILLPLAGPANRQGRLAADAIMGRPRAFRGVQGTAVCGAFDLTVACTGANERTLKRLNRPYNKVYLHPGHHVSYYPNAKPIDLKLLFDPTDGKILGAQAVGEAGVDKRIDAIASFLQLGGTVFDLEEAELCYAPQFGAAKDPANMAAAIAANCIRGDAPLVHWLDWNWETEPPQLPDPQAMLLDVRDPSEVAAGHVPGAVNIPLSELRSHLTELPRDRPIYVTCQVGQRAYYATRVLRLDGFDAYNLTGGYQTYLNVKAMSS
jgi:NADPH-dependent 2,4-dienoyl-CoA reductase/sulfur reductase-like enzyme/rhodanese-related sulfurtransferase